MKTIVHRIQKIRLFKGIDLDMFRISRVHKNEFAQEESKLKEKASTFKTMGMQILKNTLPSIPTLEGLDEIIRDLEN